MRKIFKRNVILLGMFFAKTVFLVGSSTPCTPRDQIIKAFPYSSVDSLSDDLSAGNSTSVSGDASVSRFSMPSVLSASAGAFDNSAMDVVTSPEAREVEQIEVARGRECCTPVELDEDLRSVSVSASGDNQRIVDIITEELQALRQEEAVSVDRWKVIFRNLKDIKDSPLKPDLRKRTIVAVSKIVAEEAFKLLQSTQVTYAQQVGAMFMAISKDIMIEAIVKDAAAVFDAQVDISALPAWIVKKCFEKVENDCKSPERHAGLRGEILGLPLIRSMHIVHGHTVIIKDDKANIAREPILVDPKTGAVSLVWNRLEPIADDGTPKGRAGKDYANIRKTVFPLCMSNQDVVACVDRSVKTLELGTACCANCILKLFKDPQSGIIIQVIYDASGALISTAYPMRVLKAEDLNSRKPIVIMNKYAHVDLIRPKSQDVRGIALRRDEILSYVALSDRIIADCGETVIVDIGHIEPLCSMLVSVDLPVALQAKSNSKKSGREVAQSEEEQDFSAKDKAANFSQKKIRKYCPIGVEMPTEALKDINPTLYDQVNKSRQVGVVKLLDYQDDE